MPEQSIKNTQEAIKNEQAFKNDALRIRSKLNQIKRDFR